jgi:hypothetical protein
MSLRLLVGSLILGSFALIRGFMPAPAAQAPEKQLIGPKWEYKSLNSAGNEGWELVSYERLSITFPKDAEGTLLIRPAATGQGKEHTPQTADSFQGTMTLKMAQAQPGACRFLFKRVAPAAARR